MLRVIKYAASALAVSLALGVIFIAGWFWRAGETLPSGIPPVTSEVYDESFRQAGISSQDLLVNALIRYKLPSLSLAVGVDGELIWAGAAGYRDIRGGKPATLRTAYRVGSISKSMTAAVLFKLHEQGMLDKKATLGQYARGIGDPWGRVTLTQLAVHQAGVRHYPDGAGMYLENFSNTHYPDTEAAIAVIDQDTPLFEPGANFHYSTYGYTLLALGMEAATGVAFPELMHRELIQPLGMEDTALDGHAPAGLEVASTYLLLEGSNYRAPDVDLSYKYAGGGYLSTPRDLVILGNGLLYGRLLSEDGRNRLWQVAALNNGRPNAGNYAHGLYVHRTDLGTMVSHGGKSVGGYSFLAIFPEHNIVVSMASNTTPSGIDLSREELAGELASMFGATSEMN